jgi:two-component system response regulator AtoC
MDQSNKKYSVFIVEDNIPFSLIIKNLVEHYLFSEVTCFASAEALLAHIEKAVPDLIITAYHLDGHNPEAMSGRVFIQELNRRNIPVPIVMQSHESNIALAVDLIKDGAIEYLCKDELFEKRLEKVLLQFSQIDQLNKQINQHTHSLNKDLKRLIIIVVMVFTLLMWYLASV